MLGHRNWIVIVDSAYPLQSTPGLEVVDTHTSLLQVLGETLRQIDRSPHVRANIFQDAELQYVPEADAPGIGKLRTTLQASLKKATASGNVVYMLHEELIGKVADAGKDFHILVLKSNEVLPYTSVFLQLDCKYWSAEAEKRLRASHKF